MTDQEYDFWAGWRQCEVDGGKQATKIEAAISEGISEYADGYLTCLEWHNQEEVQKCLR